MPTLVLKNYEDVGAIILNIGGGNMNHIFSNGTTVAWPYIWEIKYVVSISTFSFLYPFPTVYTLYP